MKFKKTLILIFSMLFILTNFSYSYANVSNISSDAAILIENSTNEIVFEKNSNQKLEPASVTKILTAILTIENTNLNDIVTVNSKAVSSIPDGYSIADLKPDEKISIDSLLKLLLVHSANDAANVLAFHIDGSIEAFANRMNEKCKKLNMTNTNFTNPSGMHDENHYSTAYDIAILMQYCSKNSSFKKYSNLKSCKIPATNKSEERFFNNTNKMILDNNQSQYYYPYIISSKTGFTSQAKHCLASVANNNNLSYTCVILSAPTSDIRFNDTKYLFEYGFSNFGYKTIAKKGAVLSTIDIKNGTDETKKLNLILDKDINVFTNIHSNENNFLPQITIQNIPLAPIAKNKILGSASYNINEKTYTANLLAESDVQVKTSTSFFIQLLLLILVIIVLFAVFFWNTKNKNEKENENEN